MLAQLLRLSLANNQSRSSENSNSSKTIKKIPKMEELYSQATLRDDYQNSSSDWQIKPNQSSNSRGNENLELNMFKSQKISCDQNQSQPIYRLKKSKTQSFSQFQNDRQELTLKMTIKKRNPPTQVQLKKLAQHRAYLQFANKQKKFYMRFQKNLSVFQKQMRIKQDYRMIMSCKQTDNESLRLQV